MLAIINNAAVIVGVGIYFRISVFVYFRLIPRSEFLECMLVSVLIFEETPCCYPEGLYQVIFPPTVHRIAFSPQSCQHLLSLVFLVKAIEIGVW